MERKAETKSEYYKGEIFAMAGASREHNLISTNIIRLLANQLLERTCSIYSSDMKVKIDKIHKYIIKPPPAIDLIIKKFYIFLLEI